MGTDSVTVHWHGTLPLRTVAVRRLNPKSKQFENWKPCEQRGETKLSRMHRTTAVLLVCIAQACLDPNASADVT
jgi:hypothetical protein